MLHANELLNDPFLFTLFSLTITSNKMQIGTFPSIKYPTHGLMLYSLRVFLLACCFFACWTVYLLLDLFVLICILLLFASLFFWPAVCLPCWTVYLLLDLLLYISLVCSHLISYFVSTTGSDQMHLQFNCSNQSSPPGACWSVQLFSPAVLLAVSYWHLRVWLHGALFVMKLAKFVLFMYGIVLYFAACQNTLMFHV